MLAALLLAAAAAAWVGAPPTVERLHRDGSVAKAPVRPLAGRWVTQALVAASAIVVVGLGFGVVAAGWSLVVGIVVGTVGWAVRRARADQDARKLSDETARAVMGLAMLLRSGQIPNLALSEAARDAPELAPVAAAARLGGDVGQAFREVARATGRAGLARVAAAWQVAERSGAPIATVLLQVAEGLRRERELAGIVEAEMAMARGSARVMAVLPLGALLLGTLVGADPLGFLMGHPLGLVLALVGTSLAAGGVVWTEKLAAKP